MSSEKITFDEDERDYLQELLNVSFGGATAVISDMLETFATLHIPEIELIDVSEIQEYINKNFESSNEYFVFSQQFRGQIEGESIFISDFNSVKQLSMVVHEDTEYQNDTDDVEEIISLTSELMNMLNSTTIKDIAKQLAKEVFLAQPIVKKVKSNEIIGNTNLVNYKTIIMVSTHLDFKEENIKGTLYILLKPKTVQIIKEEAEKFFEGE